MIDLKTDIRTKFWAKMEDDDRKFVWFHKKYLENAILGYNTLYQQAKGVFIRSMSGELEKAINKYLGE